MIAALVGFGGRLDLDRMAVVLAWGSVAGSGLQVAVQLPVVARLLRSFRPSLDATSSHVRDVVRNFWPVLFSRGVVQISAYIDQFVGSLLPTGAVTGLANAQLLYTLPVSLFGMSVSAAELPAMSRAVGRRGGGGGAPADAARRRPPADGVLRHPVGGGVCSRSATWWRERSCRPGGFATRTRCTSGGSSRARRSACSPSTFSRLYASAF